MSQAIGIGYFQFDNLIRNRIPVLITSLDVSVQDLYQSLEREHIQRHLFALAKEPSLQDLLVGITDRKLRLIDAVLVICKNGQHSQSLADQLGARGYINTYFVQGGFESLQAEALASKS